MTWGQGSISFEKQEQEGGLPFSAPCADTIAQTQAASREKSRENQDRPLKKLAFSQKDCLIFFKEDI